MTKNDDTSGGCGFFVALFLSIVCIALLTRDAANWMHKIEQRITALEQKQP